jgi:hypothetical protein
MTKEQQLAILQEIPDAAFCFITLAAKSDGKVEVHQCDTFGNNIAAICAVTAKLKEIYMTLEEQSDKALVHILQNPNTDYENEDFLE